MLHRPQRVQEKVLLAPGWPTSVREPRDGATAMLSVSSLGGRSKDGGCVSAYRRIGVRQLGCGEVTEPERGGAA